MKAVVAQTSFQAGEIDPLARGRMDIKNYYQGAETLRNVSQLVQGGVRRRPGSWYIDTVDADAGRLEPFIFNDEQGYLFLFVDTKLLVYSTAGALLTTVASCAWTEAMLPRLSVAQRGDTMIVCHKDLAPQKIVRTGASSFTVSAYAFDDAQAGQPRYQPYYKFAAAAVTLTPAATTGSNVVVTASAATFASGHNGTIIRIGKKECLVTEFTDTTHVKVTVRETLASTNANADWDEQAFSAVRGYPRSCAFHEDRLWFGGSRDYPHGIWGSKVGAYFNFGLGTNLDTEGIWVAIGAEQVAEVRNMVSFRHLLLFTDTGEYYIPTDPNKPITPTTISIRRQSPYGCASVRPEPFDGAVAFVQKTGTAIREMVFAELQQAYTANSLSVLASHLIDTPVDMAVLNGTVLAPEQYLFVVMEDGSMALLHSNRSEQVTGWTKWTTEGSWTNVCAVYDFVFTLVERTIDGVDYLMLELLDYDLLLDCAAQDTSGSPTQNFSGFDHLNGETVAITTGTYSLGTAAVSSGNITSPKATTELTAGLDFTPIVKPMPVQVKIQGDSGYVISLKKRVVRSTLLVKDSLRFTVNGVPFYFRSAQDDFSEAAPLRTGAFPFRNLGWDEFGQVTVTQDQPGPLILLALENEVIVG